MPISCVRWPTSVGNHAVNSNRREHQRQRCEHSEQNHRESLRAHRIGHNLVHRHRVVHHLPAIDLRRCCARIAPSAAAGVPFADAPLSHCSCPKRQESVANLHERGIHLRAERSACVRQGPSASRGPPRRRFPAFTSTHVDVNAACRSDRAPPKYWFANARRSPSPASPFSLSCVGEEPPAQQRDSHRFQIIAVRRIP